MNLGATRVRRYKSRIPLTCEAFVSLTRVYLSLSYADCDAKRGFSHVSARWKPYSTRDMKINEKFMRIMSPALKAYSMVLSVAASDTTTKDYENTATKSS